MYVQIIREFSMGEDYNLRLTQARFSFYSLTSPYSAISFSKQFLSMETSVFLSPSEQDAILLGQRIVFGISSILNILSLICLLRETPPHQATVRNYLVLIQVIRDGFRIITNNKIQVFSRCCRCISEYSLRTHSSISLSCCFLQGIVVRSWNSHGVSYRELLNVFY